MNPITIGIIILLFIVALCYMISKYKNVNALTNNMEKGNYIEVIQLANKANMRKLVGEFNCDLFTMRAYYLLKDIEHLNEKALEMLECEYTSDKRKTFLELYYHIYLNMKDIDMADRFLNKIVKEDDQSLVKCSQYTYRVLVKKEDDLIDVMSAEIDAKVFGGFSLGTVVYLIAMQYLYKEDFINAEMYFNECLTCFHPNAIYVDLAKKHIKQLTNEK